MATLGQGQPDIASLTTHALSLWQMGREAIMCVVIVGVLLCLGFLLAPFAYLDSKGKHDPGSPCGERMRTEKEKDDLARVGSHPCGAHGDLPRPATESINRS